MSLLKTTAPLREVPGWDQASVPEGSIDRGAGKQLVFEFEQILLYGDPLDLVVIYVPDSDPCEICGEVTELTCSDCGLFVCPKGECLDEHEEQGCEDVGEVA